MRSCSDNGPPFNGKEFSSYLTGLGIRHTTSSPNYPRSQWLHWETDPDCEKAHRKGQQFREESSRSPDRLESTATGRWSAIAVWNTSREEPCNKKGKPSRFRCSSSVFNCICRAKYTKSHDKARRTKTQRALVIGEEVYFLSGKNEWQIGIVTGTTDTGRSYNILTDEGTSLRRNRSHPQAKVPRYTNNIMHFALPEPQHPPKVK